VVYHPKDNYVVHFASEKYYNYDLLEVPWLIVDHRLIVQCYRSLYGAITISNRGVVVWVRIFNPLVNIYNRNFL
jgi:hypothetical protein